MTPSIETERAPADAARPVHRDVRSEADKVRCGEKHFDAIGVPFDVVVSADDV